MLKSHKSALDRQITEAVLIQVAGPDMLLNSRGEWNICKIPRLILEDDALIEDWLSQRSNRKNISNDQEPSSGSSSSGGEGSREYGGENDVNSMGMDVSICKESKVKKSRQTVPIHPITSGLKRAVELDIMRNDFREHGAECNTEDDVRQIVENVREQEKVRIKQPREEKGKV